MSSGDEPSRPLSGDLSVEARALLDDARAATAKAAIEQGDLLHGQGRHAEAVQLYARALSALGMAMREMPSLALWIGITEERLRQDLDLLVKAHEAARDAAGVGRRRRS